MADKYYVIYDGYDFDDEGHNIVCELVFPTIESADAYAKKRQQIEILNIEEVNELPKSLHGVDVVRCPSCSCLHDEHKDCPSCEHANDGTKQS